MAACIVSTAFYTFTERDEPFKETAQSVGAGLHSAEQQVSLSTQLLDILSDRPPTIVHRLALDLAKYDFMEQNDWIRSDCDIAIPSSVKMV